MICSLCNEAFEEADAELGEIVTIEDEHWHSACYVEYFGETLEKAEY